MYTGVLDARNDSTQALRRKGFTLINCFAADFFPRRILKRGKNRQSIRKVFKQFVSIYEDLYRSYRQVGGQITIIFGKKETLPWHLSVCRKDKVICQKIYTAESKQYSVWIERVSNSQEVMNVTFLREFEVCLTHFRSGELLSMPITPDFFDGGGELILA